MSGNYDSRVFAAGGLGSISGVVSTLPTGAVMGEERWHNGVKYRLCCNAGNNTVYPGYVLSPFAVAGGDTPYSMTATYATGTFADIGAAVVDHATVATGQYFWGAKEGLLRSGLIASGTTMQTGYVVQMGTDGYVDGRANLASGVATGGIRIIGMVYDGPSAGTVAVRQAEVYVSFK